jgi:hypothetical protein
MKLGPCINTADFVADITDVGDATGTWNGVSGTFTVQLASNEPCGGSSTGFQSSVLNLTINGSGTINVTFSGTGSAFSYSYVIASAFLNGPRILDYESPGGGDNSCSGGAMVEVFNDSPLYACQCSSLRLEMLYFDGPVGDWTGTFTVSVS